MHGDMKPDLNQARVAAPADFALLPEIERLADKRFAEAGIGPLPPPSDGDVYETAALVLVCGKPPIGFIRIIELEGRAHLEQISVLPEHSRKGVGTILIEAAVAELRRIGHNRLTLITFENVPWNGSFYRSRGFKPMIDLTPELAKLREREKTLGLDDLQTRIVLYRDL